MSFSFLNNYECINIISFLQVLSEWAMDPKKEQAYFEKLWKELEGDPQWHNNHKLFTRTHKMKCIDWVRLSRGPASWIFQEAYEDAPRVKAALDSMIELMAFFLEVCCDVNGEEPTAEMKRTFAKHRTKVAELLSITEKGVPGIFWDRLAHAQLHIVDAVWKWNHCRNFWCFFGERFAQTYSFLF